MSVNISFMDLRLVDELAQYNSIQLIHPSMDVLVNSVLAKLGFDVTQEVKYIPSKHRSLGNKIAVDFQAVGEMNRSIEYNQFRDTTQRTVCAGYEDVSLAREMCLLMGVRSTYRNDEAAWDDGSRAKKTDPRYFSDEQLLEFGFSTGNDEEGDPYEGEYIEPDWEENLRAIKQLEALRDTIRGV